MRPTSKEGFTRKQKIVASFQDVAKVKVRHAGPVYKLYQLETHRGWSSLRLSPLLHSSYTNDITHAQTSVQLALFPDDNALYLPGNNFRCITPRLQRAISVLTQWFHTWSIEVNPEKSGAIFFNHSKIKKPAVVQYNSPDLRI
ncbi:hypothetical protein EVAR_46535_1 [Eumeta japonica]|uniref:Uncharacterized protein n=1 Tax=Eumeta variegata TaxID=151549 RepID=A0A4C1XMA8_EUMVA|nr:hypothetical protein EVAR_46535_1 [Eumeta japonica]